MNKCYKTNCVEGKYNTITDTCSECLPGFVLFKDGKCYSTCPDSNYFEDYENKVCRAKCPTDQYPNPNNVNLCLQCSALNFPVTNRCSKCAYSGVIGKSAVVCQDCVNAMTVNAAGTCAIANCRTVNTADPTKCDVCVDGFYRAWDFTRCYARNIQDVTKSCPSNYVTYSNPNVCGPICPAGQYANATTKLCQSCSNAATGGI